MAIRALWHHNTGDLGSCLQHLAAKQHWNPNIELRHFSLGHSCVHQMPRWIQTFRTNRRHPHSTDSKPVVKVGLPSGAPELLLCSSLPQQKIRPSWNGGTGVEGMWDLARLTTELAINILHHSSTWKLFDKLLCWEHRCGLPHMLPEWTPYQDSQPDDASAAKE